MSAASLGAPFEPAGTLAEQAYLRLRDALILLDIAPGEPIRENELAASYGIGRTPIREALKRLESEHLVVSYPRRGTFATQVEIADLVHISELRTILEPVAAAKAAACRDAELLAALAELAAQAGALPGDDERALPGDDERALLEFDVRVHRTIYAAAGNPHLSESLIRLGNLATRIWMMLQVRLQHVPEHVGEHAGLLQAILDHDAEAAAALAADHVRHFEHMVRTAIAGR